MVYDPFGEKAADDFLEGGAPAAKWPSIGHVFEGTVLGWEMAQQTDYDTSEPLFWDGKRKVLESAAKPGAKPVMQLILEVQGPITGETWGGLQNERVELPDDDGLRRMYVKGGLQMALKTARKNAGGAKLEVGAHVRVERTKNGPKTDVKKAAPHRYNAVWTPAAQNVDAANALLDEDDDEKSPF